MSKEKKKINWNLFQQRQGKMMQESTIEFQKLAIKLIISPNKNIFLSQYLGVLHSDIYKQLIFWEQKSIGEASVQEIGVLISVSPSNQTKLMGLEYLW